MSLRAARARIAGPLLSSLGMGAFVLACFGRARADVDLGAFVRGSAESRLPRVFSRSPGVVTEVSAAALAPRGFVPIGTTPNGSLLGVLDLGASRLFELAVERPELRLAWSPPLRLLLDRADEWVRAARFRNVTGLTGRGVLVGIVDTGMDPRHPDLRAPDGSSRIRYWLDFGRERAELHSAIEDQLGCRTDPNDEEGAPCAVLNGEDVERLLENGDPADDPHDPIGHGTHVASLAAGNGGSDEPRRYVGLAPEASLVVARVLRRDGAIYDTDVLRAARFVFDRADELGMPAVVNLSLGSDFGGHDGNAPLERGLESLVGPDFPGRAMVVAAGNSAGLYVGLGTGAPEPLGVHTEVHVPDGATAIVPVLTPVTGASAARGTVYVWVATRPGDELRIGVDDGSRTLLPPVPPGREAMHERAGLEVVVMNGVHGSASPLPQGSSGAVVMLDGDFAPGEVFGLRLEGPATAGVWVQGEGAFHPERSVGPLVPRAIKDATINVPASAPGLIAVGATLNRTDWVDVRGETVSFRAHGVLADAPVDTTAFFSSAGPNALGMMKPDIVAPGAFVIGAMASSADPRRSGSSGMFADAGGCEASGLSSSCLLADDTHGVSAGTSMSAPLVAGAVALLFERDPALDQARVRTLLQAGARPLEGVIFDEQQVGPGALDLERTLEALEAGAGERLPGTATELVLAASSAYPDPSFLLRGVVKVRDDAGHVADGFDERRLRLDVQGAELVEPPRRLAPGLLGFAVAAPAGSGGRKLSLTLTFDGGQLAEKSVPIAVDPALASELASARGGCALSGVSRAPAGWFALGLAALALLVRRGTARVHNSTR